VCCIIFLIILPCITSIASLFREEKKGSKIGYQLIRLFKRNLKIMVSLQWTKGYVNYGCLFMSCRDHHM